MRIKLAFNRSETDQSQLHVLYLNKLMIILQWASEAAVLSDSQITVISWYYLFHVIYKDSEFYI